MGKPQRRFGKEHEAEAVRLVETSGRTQREIAGDLGIGLSTLRRWVDKRRERDLLPRQGQPVRHRHAVWRHHRQCPLATVRTSPDGGRPTPRSASTPPRRTVSRHR